jgi:catechol 2,3-dioxygenase-like lactoylglutathione lyase family enzyme
VALREMEHFLVLSDDIEATAQFYGKVLGLRVGFRPGLAFPGYWIYLGETPCIHVAERASYERYLQKLGVAMPAAGASTGPIDHIAFNCDDFAGMQARLDAQGVPYKRDTLPGIELRQLFVHDPNGIKIELNFRRELAAR